MEQGTEFILQGRRITAHDIETVKSLIISNPSWNRTHLSKELCTLWNWRRASGTSGTSGTSSANGEFKDIACRTLLRKLDHLGYIRLPKGKHQNDSPARRNNIEEVSHCQMPIQCLLNDLYPISVQLVENGYGLKLFKYCISKHHYLGWSGTVGENLKYLIFDANDRPLGCMMWGAAAWKVQARDSYIGWNAEVRCRKLSFVVNNNRFLILPWVKVSHLASHILGKICRRLSHDWQQKYHHPVYLAETFVEKNRFKGTCYKASNWIHVGVTKGRGKLDVNNQYLLPVKDIWLYPLETSFREKLCSL